jgi:hypothetical protein
MSTGEPVATESGHGWFGGGSSEKGLVNWHLVSDLPYGPRGSAGGRAEKDLLQAPRRATHPVTPLELQGQAAAGVGFISLSSVPIGFLFGGGVAEILGVEYAILIGSLVGMLSGIWCVPLLNRLGRTDTTLSAAG